VNKSSNDTSPDANEFENLKERYLMTIIEHMNSLFQWLFEHTHGCTSTLLGDRRCRAGRWQQTFKTQQIEREPLNSSVLKHYRILHRFNIDTVHSLQKTMIQYLLFKPVVTNSPKGLVIQGNFKKTHCKRTHFYILHLSCN